MGERERTSFIFKALVISAPLLRAVALRCCPVAILPCAGSEGALAMLPHGGAAVLWSLAHSLDQCDGKWCNTTRRS